MSKLYDVEMYHWGHDYWSRVGSFSAIEVANEVKIKLESENKSISCSIFEKDIFDSSSEYLLAQIT